MISTYAIVAYYYSQSTNPSNPWCNYLNVIWGVCVCVCIQSLVPLACFRRPSVSCLWPSSSRSSCCCYQPLCQLYRACIGIGKGGGCAHVPNIYCESKCQRAKLKIVCQFTNGVHVVKRGGNTERDRARERNDLVRCGISSVQL